MSKKTKILIIIPILLLVIILMSMNISSLKKLFADINSLSMGMTTFKDWSESPTTLDSKYSNSTIFLTKDSSFEVYRNKDGEVKKYMCDYSKFNGSDTYTTEAEEYMKNSNYKFLIQWSKIDVTENGDTYTFCFPRVEIDLLDGETYQNLDNDVELTEGFSILAKNSAINANGNYIDAVLTTKNLVFWNNKELDAKYVYKSRITTLSLEGITSGQYSRLDSEGSSQVPVVLGIPIEFNLDHMIGQVDASLSYYEADTYNTPNQKYADVKNIIGLYSDIDVWNDKTYLFSDKIFKGNEGVAFTNSENVKTIYYDVDGQYGKQIQLTNKDGSKTATDYQARLKTVTATDGNNKEYSGLYIDDEVRTNANVKDIHEKTSIFITEDLDNEKIFNFRYASARSAGIRFCFVSPIKYDIAGPVKTSSVTKTTYNKNYIYHIIQKIPNNYYGYALKFANYSGTLYNSISISDIFDEKLTNIDKNKITIVNENDLDVTKYFDISLSEVNGKTKLVATISSSNSDNFISQVDFYNHTYKVNVPVTTKDKINKNKISNKASTTVDNDTSNILESNNVDVDVYYTVTINHIDEYNNAILKTTTDEVIYGNTFSSNKEDFENYEYDYNESDTNDGKNSGVVNKNITVNYYYKKKATVTVNYYKEGTTEKLADSDTLNKYYGDKYDVTSYKDNKNISTDYKYVSYTSTPENTISGTVSQDTIIVNYYYVLKTATINIKYLDELTNKSILNEENIQTKYGVEYSSLNLDSYKKEITGYDYSKTETTPKEISGKVNQDTTTIIHYYKKKSSITIKYVDKYTNKEIDGISSDVINNYYGDSYNTEENRAEKEKNSIFNNYTYTNEYVVTPENTSLKGTMNTDTITISYYYKKKATVTVNYYKEGTTEKLADSDTLNKYYGDTYDVSTNEYKNKSTIPSKYEYSSVNPSNEVTGTITKSSIIINYYYKLKDAKIVINYLEDKTNNKLAESTVIDKKYDDKYDVTNYKDNKNISTDYKYVSYTSTPENTISGTVSQDTIIVNYYYVLKTATINIKYLDELTNKSILNEENIQTKYGVEYSSLNLDSYKKEITGYDYSKTETTPKEISGKVNQDTTTIIHYYKKKSSITIKYVDKYTNKEIDGISSDVINNYYGDSYNTEENRAEKEKNSIFNNYTYTNEYVVTPENTSLKGTMNTDTITISYYYKKKSSITINYIDKYTNAKISGISSDVINNHYGDSYNTENKRTEKEKNTIFNDYDYANEYVITPENTSLNGTISTDNIVVNYYYNKKSNITIKYYDIETKKEIAKENVDNKVHYGDIYNVESKKIETEKEEIFKNYNFEKYESNSKQSDDLKQIKIDNENVTVDLYYRLKTSTITIKYLEETTNKELAETYTKNMKYTEVYNATEIRDKAGVPKNYNLVRHESSTGVLSGTISEPSVLIIFYYEKKDPKLETSVSKTGTKEITRKDAEVGYKLNYKAVIKDYIGDAKVTYIDKLPYEIDEEKSDISGGKYNKETKKIIWEETYEKINMEKEITFTKEIKVVYTGIEDTDRIMTNEIETTIKLDNKENTVTSDYDTDIKIPGEIVIHYYDKETKEKLAKDIEKTDLIGNQYVSEEKEFEGYKLVSKPESNVHIYKEKEQEFSYEYEKIKFKITTKVEGEGGTIEGDEIVKYGEDSSKDKIKIKAADGYEIDKITINGESYEITDRNEIIMPYFKEVKEDKEVIVSFVKKIENPKTLDNIMSYIGYGILSIIGLVISGIVLIKNKTQEKI